MEYTVLARRFRPQSFGEVIGQESIAQALRNAIAAGRVAHAYLFTGARGVGKTSTARILAKSLNCPNAKDGDPCNACEICRSISVGSDVDVVEIDGASNRGIEEIRDLRANVNVKPMRCRHKIYIIDEVHMLTVHAFNALLKTLEEPPANVKFVFCTTEPDKVPDTILSRCQRFDFGTIATDTIRRRLTEIAAAEGVEVAPAAIDLVARRAAGSMRDSQSLFDQLLAFGGKSISADDVHRLLGTAPDERLVDLVGALVGREPARALALLDSALGQGVQLSELTDQLIACFRDLMVLAAGAADAGLLAVGNDQREALAQLAGACGLQTILAALQILSEAKSRMKGVTYGRVLAELALVRAATLAELDNLAELVSRLKAGQMSTGSEQSGAAARGLLPGASGPGASPSRLSKGSMEPTSALPATAPTVKKNDLESPVPGDTPPPTVVAELRNPIPFEFGKESEIWSQVISSLTDMTRSHARNVSRAAISGPNQLVLTIPKSYHLSKQYFERSPDQLGKLEAAVESAVGRRIALRFEVDDSSPATESTAEPRPGRPEFEKKISEASRDPLVQKAIAAFGATIVRVEQGIGG